MTVALVWTLLVWTPVQGGVPLTVIDGFPTKQHCDAMAHEVKRRQPGFLSVAYTACVQRQIVVASK